MDERYAREYVGGAGAWFVLDTQRNSHLTQAEMVELLNTINPLEERLAELKAELVKMKGLVRDGFDLSAFAAAINWDGSPNTQEWLDGLRAHIEGFQEKALAVTKEFCPIHDFPFPCPSCRDVAIAAGVTDFSDECEHGFASSCPMNCN